MQPFDPSHLAVYLAMGAFGGLVRALVTGKGYITLPKVEDIPGASPHLNLGFLAPMLIGALAGLLAPAVLHINGVVSAIGGYAGADFIENLIERFLKSEKGGKLK